MLAAACALWVGIVRAETHAIPSAADLRIAAERFDEGRNAFRVGAFAEAAEQFEAADARAPSASALGLAMRSRAEAGQAARAATLAELVLRRHPDDADLAEKAKSIVEAAAGTCGRVSVECQPDCDLVVDEKLIHGRATGYWTLYLDPGPHAVVANWSQDRVGIEQIIVTAGTVSALKFKPAEPERSLATATRPNASIEPVDRRSSAADTQSKLKKLPPTIFWIGVGATVAMGGASIWSGIDTLKNPGPAAVRDQCAGLGESCALYRQGQRSELRTNVLIGTTIVLAAATAVTGIFFTDFSRMGAVRNVGTSHDRIRPWVEARHVPVARGSLGVTTVVGAEGRF
jgi:hypothetical protein